MLTQDGEHAKWLYGRIQDAKKAVEIVSAWTSRSALSKVLEKRSGGVAVNVIFRWPKKLDEVIAVGAEAILEARGTPNLHFHFIERLHAKVYLIDGKHALVTSANLTRRGLGEGYSPNVELGVVLPDSEVPRLRDWIQRQRAQARPLDDVAAKKLEEALQAAKQARKRVPELMNDIVEPPTPQADPAGIMRYLYEVGWLFSHRKLRTRTIFEVTPADGIGPFVVRINRSGKSAGKVSYGFELEKEDILVHLRRRKGQTPPVSAVLHCPTEGGKLIPNTAPPVLVFFDELIRLTGSKAALRRSVEQVEGHASVRLEEVGSVWKLVYPGLESAGGGSLRCDIERRDDHPVRLRLTE